jgi:hypothetical protein
MPDPHCLADVGPPLSRSGSGDTDEICHISGGAWILQRSPNIWQISFTCRAKLE